MDERDARIAYLEHVNQDLQAMVEDLERRNEWLWREIGALRVEKAKTSSPGLNTHLAPHSAPLKALGRLLRLVQGIRGLASAATARSRSWRALGSAGRSKAFTRSLMFSATWLPRPLMSGLQPGPCDAA